jgi:uncharacterized RDD family membrane protein YckC
MKCPKCSYLGFETGDRCKNCGYDFSLIAAPSAAVPDLPLRRDADAVPALAPEWDRFDSGMTQAVHVSAPDAETLAALPADAAAAASAATAAFAPRVANVEDAPAPERRMASSLPLFRPSAGDDEPLIKVPAAPRPPLAVRRTPDKPRLKTVPKPATNRRQTVVAVLDQVEPELEFPTEASTAARPDRAARTSSPAASAASAPAKRIAAAAIDHGILGGIDAAVLYFTLKMAGLPVEAWRALPPAPLVAFLSIITIGYFWAFTAIGGQTIGKMAMGIRVVDENERTLLPAAAFRRTVTGILSVVSLGLLFVPALIGDRRAIHDRVARTRVVELR